MFIHFQRCWLHKSDQITKFSIQKVCNKQHKCTLLYKHDCSITRFLYYTCNTRSSEMHFQSCVSEKSSHVEIMLKYWGKEFQIQRGFNSAENKAVEFHRWPFLSSLLLHSFDCSPSLQVGEKQCKVNDVCWHADHTEVPQNESKNRCQINRASHWHPGGKHQKWCSFFGQRESCKTKTGVKSS